MGPAWATPQSRASPAAPRMSKDRLSWKPIKLDILQHNNDLFTSGSRVHHDSVWGGVGWGLGSPQSLTCPMMDPHCTVAAPPAS